MKRTKILTECAVFIALTVLCSFIKIFEMPQGGSISLTMVPLFIISYRRGAVAGIFTGSIYGFVSLMFSGIIYHPASILLDYILAFGIVGVSGFFRKNIFGIITGTCTGVVCRFVCSLLSGVFIFKDFAPVGQNPWTYSFVYQCTYLLPELIICIFVMLFIVLRAEKIIKIK